MGTALNLSTTEQHSESTQETNCRLVIAIMLPKVFFVITALIMILRITADGNLGMPMKCKDTSECAKFNKPGGLGKICVEHECYQGCMRDKDCNLYEKCFQFEKPETGELVWGICDIFDSPMKTN